jgi:hypothetical protein
MAVAATVKYFGRFPTTIVLQSSGQFVGSAAPTSQAVITPGLYVFPADADSGVYAFHEDPVEVKQIAFSGGGTLTVTKVVGVFGGATTMSSVIAVITGATPVDLTNFFLSPGEYLTFASSGSTAPKISITGHLAAYISDGAS